VTHHTYERFRFGTHRRFEKIDSRTAPALKTSCEAHDGCDRKADRMLNSFHE
jgi:hypothetical protein